VYVLWFGCVEARGMMFDWGVLYEQRIALVRKERRCCVHTWASCRKCVHYTSCVRVVVWMRRHVVCVNWV